MGKRAKFFLKLGAAFAVALAAALAVGTYALKKYLPPEKVRALVVDNARRYLKREVRIQGIDLKVLTGLTITGLEVSETPDFKAGQFASAETFQLRVLLLPLLAKNIVVDKIILDGFNVQVLKGKDGRFNFSDLIGSSEASKSPSGQPAERDLPMDLAIRQLTMTKSSLAYKDAVSGNVAALTEIDASVADFASSGFFDANTSLKLSGRWDKKPLSASIKYKGRVDLADMKQDKMALAIERASVELPEGALEASGTLANMHSPEVSIQLTLKGKNSEAVSVDVSGTMAELRSEAPEARLKVKAKTPLLKSDDFPKAVGAPKGLVLPPAQIETEFELKGEGVLVKDFRLDTTGAKITVRGALSKIRSERPEPDLSLTARLDVPALGSADLAALKAMKIAVPENLKTPAFKAEADAVLKGDDLNLKKLSLSASGVDLSASGLLRQIRSQRPDPDLTLKARLDIPALKSSDLGALKAWDVAIPEGLTLPSFTVDADLYFKGSGMTAKAFKVKSSGLTAEASGDLREMYSKKPAHDLELSVKLDLPALKSADLAILNALKIAVPAGIDVPASSLQARARLEGDSLTLRELRFKTQGASVEGAGTVKRLWSGKPDADVTVKAAVDIPAITAKDLAILKMAKMEVPDLLSLPASKTAFDAHFKGTDLRIKSLNLKAQGVSVAAHGTVANVLTKPAPEISVKLDLDLPVFTSADIAFLPGVPPDLRLPASKTEAELTASLNAVDIKFLRLATGSNNLSMKGRIVNFDKGSALAYDMTMMSKNFSLSEITQITPKTRELNLAGKGSFRLKVAQKPPERPYYIGDMNFTGLGASVAGIQFSDFAGSGRFDENEIDFPKITGKVDGGKLEMDLTVKNYAKTPSIDSQSIILDEFDLGKYLAAKAALGTSAATSEKPAPTPPFNFKCRGFNIGRVKHPLFNASDARFQWDLYGITPDFKNLDGEAQMRVSTGTLEQINKLALQYPAAKVVMVPLMVIQNVAGLGIIKILPDLKHIAFSRIDGDYSFSNGKMTVKRSVLDSRAALVQASGTVDLPSEALDLDVNAKVGHYPGINMTVRGTIANPDAKLGYRKIISEVIKAPLQEPLKKVLGEPGKELLDKLLKRP